MRLVIRPLGRPAAEFLAITRGEPSQGELTYVEMHSFAFPDRPTLANLPVSTRLAATSQALKQRLSLISELLRRIEVLGWSVTMNADLVEIQTELSVEDGWAVLRREGISDHLLAYLEKGSDGPPPGSIGPERDIITFA